MNDPVAARLQSLENAVGALTSRLTEIEERVREQAESVRRAEQTSSYVADRRRTIDRLHEQYQQQRND